MIAPLVDHHVHPRRHVAIDAFRPVNQPHDGDAPGVEFRRVVRLVALRAKIVSLVLQFQRMRVVTIGAFHVVRVHLALQKRIVLVHLVEYLPVRLVQSRRSRTARSDSRMAGPLFYLAPFLRGEGGVRGCLRALIGSAGMEFYPRHCERSEAIQTVSAEGFWIASLRSQ